MITMRQRFYQVVAELLEEDPRVAVVLAEIGAGELRPHPRLVQRRDPRAADGRRRRAASRSRGCGRSSTRTRRSSSSGRSSRSSSISSTRASERCWSVRGRRTTAPVRAVRTRRPRTCALLRALPGWTIHVPGHPDEVDRFVRRAAAGDDNVYVRLSEEVNAAPVEGDGLVVVRSRPCGARRSSSPSDRPSTRCWRRRSISTRRSRTCRPSVPSTRQGSGRRLRGTDVVLVEPYLAGTSAAEVAAALVRPSPPPARPRCRQRRDPPLRHRPGAPSPARPRRGRDPAVDRGVPGSTTPTRGGGLPLTPCRRRYRPDAHASGPIL